MEYHEAVNRLEGLRRLRPKLGTDTTASMLSFLDDPHEDLRAVQVAGSNGKGSTARILDQILQETDCAVGRYTSPDLNDIRDRVTVRGQKIPKRAVVEFVEEIWPHVVDRSAEGDPPTFFEVFTVLALWHFDREDVDVAVLEVGIGGRYDATSVVDPVAAAVTNVSLEHTDILGATIEEIARDKVSVAPADVPLVTGATGVALDVIRDETDVVTVGGPPSKGAGEGTTAVDAGVKAVGPDVTAREGELVSPSESHVSIAGPDWAVETRSSMLGQHQAVNAGMAAVLARQVAGADEDAIAAGIRNATWPGRFEVMGHEPFVVLDGAHNPAACAKLASLLDRYDYESLHLVFGAMRDKAHGAMVDELPAADFVHLAEPAVERAENVDTLAAVFERQRDASVETHDSVLGAVGSALREADGDDCVLVAGSLYIVGEARDRFTRAPAVVRTDTPTRADAAMKRADVPASVRRARTDEMVTRTVHFHARRGPAHELRETMRAIGGTGSVSGISDADQHVEVVLTGTLAQFQALLGQLRGSPGECGHLADQLATALALGGDDAEARATALDSGGTDAEARYPWHEGTAVMGILNVTPDSFYDGGEYDAVSDAVARAREMVASGADIVDVGGESTRPGADPLSAEAERDRVVPVVERLSDLDAICSVDTRKPTVAEAALAAGADMVNDVTGLSDADMRRVVADHGVPAVVMHSLSTPVDPDRSYDYDDVVSDVLDALTERVLLAERAGIDRSQLIVDPGLGFGKRATESFELLDRLEEFRALGTPVMVGHSQKSMFQQVGCDPDERLAPTVAATALAAERGADIVRVHEVKANAAAVRTARQTVSPD